MADMTLEIMRMKLRIQQIQVTKYSHEVRIAELLDEKRRIEENFALQDAEIADCEEKIKAFSAQQKG